MRHALRAAGLTAIMLATAWLQPVTLPAGASAPRWYCSTTTTQGEACIPDTTTTMHVTTTHPIYVTTTHPTTTIATTTTATTLATTTTAKQTTTIPSTTTVSIPPFCIPASGLCLNIDPTTTTAATTTTSASTTVPVVTTPAPTTSAAPTTTVTPETTVVTKTLPVTGSNETTRDLELAVGFGLIFAGWAAYALRAALKR